MSAPSFRQCEGMTSRSAPHAPRVGGRHEEAPPHAASMREGAKESPSCRQYEDWRQGVSPTLALSFFLLAL